VVVGTELQSPNELTLVSPQGERASLEYDAAFRTCSFGAAGEFTAPLVFCGYGVVAPKEGYDDFADVDVKGKVAVILRRTPQQEQEDGMFGGPHAGTSRHAALNTKLSNALSRGAAAVLFVNDAYTGRAELAKLHEQREAAEKQVIDAAIELVARETSGAHHHGHAPHHLCPAKSDKAEDESADESPREPESTDKSAGDSPGNAPEPANPPGEHAPHGHGTAEPVQSLRSAVTHLQEVRKLIAEYDADPLMEFGYNGDRRGESVPVLHVRRSAINTAIESVLGKTLEEVEAAIDATGKPHSASLDGWRAEGQTSLTINRADVKNVIGVLPGAGPLARETIVVGAHYDHLGRGGSGSLLPGSTEIHNGADDNASGTVALIELARRLAAREEPLPRTVVFIAFTGEERGLLGSAHYVKNPVFPLESTIAMFNMDMVGRLTDDELTVFGTGTASGWDEWLDAEAAERRFTLSKKPEGLGPSDHSSFYAREIPVLHFFTGTHNDYHRPTDDWGKINVVGIHRIVDLLEELVTTTALSDARPEYVEVKGRAEMAARSGSRPYFGSIPDFSGAEASYAIQGVSPGSPADKAGLKGGDVIIKLGEYPITGLDDFDLALREFSPGEDVTVTVRRDGKEQAFRLTLATPR
jgi:hypothetical protein